MSYKDPKHQCVYRFPAIDLASASEQFIKGPAGLEGRLVGIASVITVTTTTTVTVVDIGTQTDPNAYGTHTIPVGVAEVSQNAMTRGVDNVIPADGLVTVLQDGGAAAGDGDILVYIDWF